jgi:hypothetical protein
MIVEMLVVRATNSVARAKATEGTIAPRGALIKNHHSSTSRPFRFANTGKFIKYK